MSAISIKHDAADLARLVDCLTENELCRLAGISASTADAWRRRGTGPAYVCLGNAFLYPRQHLVDFMNSKIRFPRTAAAEGGL